MSFFGAGKKGLGCQRAIMIRAYTHSFPLAQRHLIWSGSSFPLCTGHLVQ